MNLSTTHIVAIAGASGFIGKALIESLLQDPCIHILALSRKKRESTNPRVKWVKCDLFSVLEIEQAIKGADSAYYLVHSMLPSAQLDQGRFEDYDLLLADNFARAAEKEKIKRIIYLGGIIPNKNDLSTHLRSRKEVEGILAHRSYQFIALRAGLILGKGGSSFNIMFNLVNRLPIMICPPWTNSPMTPISVRDCVYCLSQTLIRLKQGEQMPSVIEIGGPKTYTYLELMQILALKLKKKRLFYRVPFDIMFVSRFWVRLFSGASKELVYPLVESLKSPMDLHPENLFFDNQSFLDYQQSLDDLLAGTDTKVQYTPPRFIRKYVRSVQRLPLPYNANADWVAREYMRWLPRFLFPFILVKVSADLVTFNFLHPKVKLLALKYSPERSTSDRRLFYIVGGMLAVVHPKGRLEFRETVDRKYIITAIHDFFPRLPWFIYRFTQAFAHLWVMYNFGKHLHFLSHSENVELKDKDRMNNE